MLRSAIVIVCRLSVTQVYCDKTAEARIMQFHYNVAQCLSSLPAEFDSEFRRESPWSGAQTGVRWFSIEFATLYLGNCVRYSLGDN